MTVPFAIGRIGQLIDEVPPRLAAISESDAVRKAGPDRWAPKEILGHLIDSAANNHQRFVRAQLAPAYDCPGYDQETWVAAQHYLDEPWPALIQLWLALNRHLLHVMRNVRPDALNTPISIRGADHVPLSFVMTDYVRHLEHHLAQILPA